MRLDDLNVSSIKTATNKKKVAYNRGSNANKMAADKKNTENRKVSEVRVRKWTDRELKEFAYVLADDVNEFALPLETLIS